MEKLTRLYQTRRALEDFAEIEPYSIENWGKRVANEYLTKFEAAFDLLLSSPDLLRTKNELSGRLRFYRVEKHRLVCDIVDDDIYVLTVKRSAMDLPERIVELEPQLIHEAELMHRKIAKNQS